MKSLHASLLRILKSVPPGKRKAFHSSPSSATFIYTMNPIVYTGSIHDCYSIVYTETSDASLALTMYTTYHESLCPGGKLVYYIDAQRQSVNVAVHTISTEAFEITYYPQFIVFTKTSYESDLFLHFLTV
jgi:hypothetical protein